MTHKTKPPQNAGVVVVTLNLDFISLHRGYACYACLLHLLLEADFRYVS
jgi:hypothetical protein